jgi:3-dehydroquinate synthase
VKASIVSRDFKESYEREVLNYGHTLGHAIEKDSGYKLRHGEAISIGLYFAAELSHAYGELPAELVDLHRNLLEKLDLPTSYEKSAWPRLAGYLRSDKKRRSENVRFVTLSNIGRTGRSEFELNKLKMVYEDKVGR